MLEVLSIGVLALVSAGCLWEPPIPVTRADLAASYLDFERALRAFPPDVARTSELNRRFDEASIAFFSGRYAGAVESIDALTASLLPADEFAAARRVAGSLKVRIEPSVYVLGSADTPTLQVGSMYLVALAGVDSLTLTLSLIEGTRAVAVRELRVPTNGATGLDLVEDLPLDRVALSAGTYRVELSFGGGKARSAGFWYAVDRSLDAVRQENDRRITAAVAAHAALGPPAEICRARNALLTDHPSEQNSAEFLSDLRGLAAEINSEINLLESGENPYFRRKGDYWRPLVAGQTRVAMRVYAPAALTLADAGAAPLVIAFHGAGGDERMFMDGYGAGIIRDLADRHSFLLATPQTYPFLTNPDLLETLIDSLSRDYAVDRERIHVLGHSLGAGAAAILSGGKVGLLAGSYCISGGRGWDNFAQIAPTVVASGTLDPIVLPATLAQSVQRARTVGLPIELRSREGYGHTLIVGSELPIAIDWLLKQRRAARTAASQSSGS